MSDQTPAHKPPTAGPWTVSETEFNTDGARREGVAASVMSSVENGGVFIAHVWGDFEKDETDGDALDIPPQGTGLSNAHLIAAAPDLLSALRDLADAITDATLAADGPLSAWHDRALEVIRKAEGR